MIVALLRACVPKAVEKSTTFARPRQGVVQHTCFAMAEVLEREAQHKHSRRVRLLGGLRLKIWDRKPIVALV